MIYLCSPYRHADPAVRRDRFRRACKQVALMMRAGCVVFSPVAHSHPIALLGGLEAQDGDFWLRQDLELLRRADQVQVLMIDGWRESRGMRSEMNFANLLHIPLICIREGSVISEDGKRIHLAPPSKIQEG